MQTGYVNQTFLKGADGKLYNASNAPGDLLYSGLYNGYETSHKRWGSSGRESFYNPLIAPSKRLENGYTVGRDAGKLVVATQAAVLDGDVEHHVPGRPPAARVATPGWTATRRPRWPRRGAGSW